MMRTALIALVAVLSAGLSRADFAEDEYAEEIERFYLGVSGSILLPQGGSQLRHLGGASLRGGWYFTDTFAIEGEAAWLEDRAGLAAQGLWHWWGYEQLDPFFTFGARGWLNDGQVGPCVGIGTFWHLDDHWSLRFDSNFTLGLDTRCEMCYQFSVGIQRSF